MRTHQTRHPYAYIVDSVGAHRGMHYYNFSLAQALEAIGVPTLLISIPETTAHPLRPESVEVRTGFEGIYGDRPAWLRGLAYGRSLLRILRWARRERPCVVHVHFFQAPALDYLFLFGLQKLGITTVTTVHDVLPFARGRDFHAEQGNIYQRLYARSSGLILHSTFAQEALHKLNPSLANKSALIPQGGYTSLLAHRRLPRSQARAKVNLAADAQVVLVFGTIKPNKRLDLAIEAIAQVRADHPQIQLVFAGKPQDRDVIAARALATRLGVAGSVRWRLEHISDEDLIAYLCAADVVLFPYEWIYQSAALLMAMSFGKTVVATAVGNNLEVVQHEKTGLLFPLGDTRALATAISRVLQDPAWAASLGRSAAAYVADELAWEKIARATLTYYEQVCAGGGG